jgi:Ca2+-binding EF-hand superfamily protein
MKPFNLGSKLSCSGDSFDRAGDEDIPTIDIVAKSEELSKLFSERDEQENEFRFFLKDAFEGLCKDGQTSIDFPTFAKWKQNMGSFFGTDELRDMYDIVVQGEEFISFDQFCEVNRVIDEQ